MKKLSKALVRKLPLTLLMACFAFINCQAQVIPDIQNSFINYQQNNLQEKIYLHTNKNLYTSGEILWFKAYTVDGANNNLLDISKVLYVDLLDQNHVSVLQTKIALKNGMGNGSVYIPASIGNGNYQVRAYTSWMKNHSSDYFFSEFITILNPVKPYLEPKKDTASLVNIQFFPEGGHFVQGLTEKVAFKVTGDNGKGINCSGVIINQNNDTITSFSTLKFGIGSFLFTPGANNSYKAIIKASNKIHIKTLPEIDKQGYGLFVTDKGSSWDIMVQNSPDMPAENVYLFVHSGKQVKLAQQISFKGNAHVELPKNKLNDGISHITLFNSAKQPICDRLVFKRPAGTIHIDAVTDNKFYATRKKINLTISVKTEDGQPLPSFSSLSVYRLDTLQKADQVNIGGYLWLSSDLRGNIESPDYYIENKDKEADEALENLLLSQGWGRFEWKNVLASTQPYFKFLPEYTGHIITGTVVNKLTGAPAANIKAYLSVPGIRPSFFTAASDSTGRLLFNTRDLYGLNEAFLQTNTIQDSIYRIEILSPFSEKFSNAQFPTFNFSSSVQNYLEDYSIDVQAQNFYFGNNLKRFYTPNVDTSVFYGTPKKSFLLDSYTRFATMEEVMIEFVNFTNTSKHDNKYSVKMINETETLPGEPLVLLDGLPVFDVNKIYALDPLKIKKIDVIPYQYLYGPVTAEGIISYSTYKGDLSGLEIDPNIVVINYDGLELDRKFYSPVYATDQEANSRIPDFRNTLYWNPDANTDQTGKSTLSFYTSDRTGKYIGIIEGITTNGETGSKYFTFEVKK